MGGIGKSVFEIVGIASIQREWSNVHCTRHSHSPNNSIKKRILRFIIIVRKNNVGCWDNSHIITNRCADWMRIKRRELIHPNSILSQILGNFRHE